MDSMVLREYTLRVVYCNLHITFMRWKKGDSRPLCKSNIFPMIQIKLQLNLKYNSKRYPVFFTSRS